MLRYFRHIRKKLMEDLPAGLAGNKVRTYFFYAIGEILLVVIGILIALQVNNWNENRKLETLKQSYIESLTEDLQLDLGHFNQQIDAITAHQVFIDSLGNELSKPQTTNTEFNQLIKDNIIVVATSDFSKVNNSSYIALRNSGKIDLFDEQLKNALLALNGYQQDYISLIDVNLDAKTTISLRFFEEIPTAIAPLKVGVNGNLESEMWADVNWPIARRKFYSTLNIHKVTNEVALTSTQYLKAETEAVLRLLKENN